MMFGTEGKLQALTGGLRVKARVQHPQVKPRKDREGWPHFRQLKSLPEMNMIEQENYLKDHILLYFQHHDF